MGAMIIGFAIYFGGIITLKVLDRFNPKSERAAKWSESIRENLFHNYIIAMMTESFSQISVCACISLGYLKWNSYGNVIQSLACISFFLSLFIYPIVVFRNVYRGWDVPVVRNMYSHIFEDLYMPYGPLGLIHPFWFLFRRFLMGIIVVYLRTALEFQFMLMALSITVAVMINAEVPHRERNKQQFEFLNESIIMLVLYSVVCFSSFVPDYQAKSTMGYFCCIIVVTHLLVNLFTISR